MKKNSRKILCAAMAAMMAASSGMFTAYALPTEEPDQEFQEAYARLQDNHMEYDELEDLIKHYYEPIRSGFAAATSTYDTDMADVASLMYEAARELDDDADDLEDLVKSGQVDPGSIIDTMTEVGTNRYMAKAYRSGASTMYRTIDINLRDSGSTVKSIQRQVNQVVYQMQLVMNGYEQLMANRQVLAKAVELAEMAKSLQQTMMAQGLAVDADILSAASSLASNRSQLESIDTMAARMKKTLCQFTGWGPESSPEIGPVPSADISAIASIQIETDKEKAVNNNYNLISLRSGKGGNMDQIEKLMTKSTTQTRNKLEDVAYSEDQVRSNLQTLYDTILEQKVAYDSAATSYRAAELTWNAAQIQRQNGSLSQIQCMQQEVAYLQAQAGLRCADLALQQAMQNYHWAVKGLSITAE